VDINIESQKDEYNKKIKIIMDKFEENNISFDNYLNQADEDTKYILELELSIEEEEKA